MRKNSSLMHRNEHVIYHDRSFLPETIFLFIIIFLLLINGTDADVSAQTIRIQGACGVEKEKNGEKVLIVSPRKDETAEYYMEWDTKEYRKTDIDTIGEFLISEGTEVHSKLDKTGQYIFESIITDEGYIELAQLIILHRDVNVKNKNGHTALMVAAGNCNKKIVELLLENGADINVKNDNGLTAFMVATNKGCMEIAELLKKAEP